MVVGRGWVVQEWVAGHTKPVRGETRNMWSEVNVVLGRIKVWAPEGKWRSVVAGECLDDDHRAGTEWTTKDGRLGRRGVTYCGDGRLGVMQQQESAVRK